MILTLSVILVCISVFAGLLRVYSPGKVIPFLDSNGKPLQGSISEKIFINIGGVRQGMFIKSKDSTNPVLLYLHGGMPDSYRVYRDPAMHSLGIGTTHDMNSVISGIFLPSLTCKEYTLTEKINMWRGKSRSGISILWEEMLTTDLARQVPELKLPVYFFEGIYDYTCSYTEAKSYFEKLKAPLKGFYTFEKSAHSPIFEEPLSAREIMLHDVLNGRSDLADN